MLVDNVTGFTVQTADVLALAPRYQAALVVIKNSLTPQPTVAQILTNMFNADLEVVRQRARELSLASNQAIVDALATATPAQITAVNTALGLP